MVKFRECGSTAHFGPEKIKSLKWNGLSLYVEWAPILIRHEQN